MAIRGFPCPVDSKTGFGLARHGSVINLTEKGEINKLSIFSGRPRILDFHMDDMGHPTTATQVGFHTHPAFITEINSVFNPSI